MQKCWYENPYYGCGSETMTSTPAIPMKSQDANHICARHLAGQSSSELLSLPSSKLAPSLQTMFDHRKQRPTIPPMKPEIWPRQPVKGTQPPSHPTPLRSTHRLACERCRLLSRPDNEPTETVRCTCTCMQALHSRTQLDQKKIKTPLFLLRMSQKRARETITQQTFAIDKLCQCPSFERKLFIVLPSVPRRRVWTPSLKPLSPKASDDIHHQTLLTS